MVRIQYATGSTIGLSKVPKCFLSLASSSGLPPVERIVIAPRHPCPNCGHLRSQPDASCLECRYPNHEKPSEDRIRISHLKHPPIQFHIRTLLAATIVAAIACDVTKHWGLDGLWLAIQIFAFLFPAIEFLYYFWINLRSIDPNAIDEYESRF
jgi:hypothetical protein